MGNFLDSILSVLAPPAEAALDHTPVPASSPLDPKPLSLNQVDPLTAIAGGSSDFIKQLYQDQMDKGMQHDSTTALAGGPGPMAALRQPDPVDLAPTSSAPAAPGFDPMRGMGATLLQELLGGAGQPTAEAPQVGMAPPLPVQNPGQSGPPLPARNPAAPQAAAPGAQGGMGEFANALKHILAGAAAGDPSQPGIKAFVTGGYGAMQSMDAEKREKTAAKLAKEKRERADSVAAQKRADKLSDRDFNRKLKLAKESRAKAKDGREARSAKLNELKTISDIKNKIDPKLGVKERNDVEDLIRKQGRLLFDMNVPPEEILPKMDEYRQQLEADFKTRRSRVNSVLENLPASNNGSSRDTPVLPTSQEQINALPPKTWVQDPATGKIWRKQ